MGKIRELLDVSMRPPPEGDGDFFGGGDRSSVLERFNEATPRRGWRLETLSEALDELEEFQ